MTWAFPLALWLLPLAVIAAWVDRRRWPLAVSRGVTMFAAVVALAGPLVTRPNTQVVRVVAIEVGPAADPVLPAEMLAAARSANRVVAYSNRAQFVDVKALSDPAALDNLRRRLSTPLRPDDSPAGGAATADALRLAGLLVPAGEKGEIRLFSTGAVTRGDAEAEAWRAGRRDIALAVNPLPLIADAPDVLVTQATTPAHARVGQTAAAEIAIASRVSGRRTVSVQSAGHTASLEVEVAPGEQRFTVPTPLPDTGTAVVTATVGSQGVRSATHVDDAPRLAVVSDEADAADALNSLLRGSVRVERIPPATLATADLRGVAAVVLDDVPASDLNPAARERVLASVRSGTGLLVTGAARSFGPGGYADSDFARLLPVSMPQSSQRIDPSVALVLIIDSSSSMDGEPLDLAKEVARLAVARLQPQDKVGLIEFFGGKRWAAPLQSARDLSALNRALARLSAQGATVLYPAVEEAAFALRNVKAQYKHILLISDGFVEEAPFAELARGLADDNIALSAVEVGKHPPGDNLMPPLAQWGGGRHYLVPSEFALPDLTLRQSRTSDVSPIVQAPTPVSGKAGAVSVRSSVNAYVRTAARPTADVLLRTEGGDPLLAVWRTGAGTVAALPTRLGSAFAGDLQRDDAFATMLADLVRRLTEPAASDLTVDTAHRPAGVEVRVASARGESQPLRLVLLNAQSQPIYDASSPAAAPGKWNLLLTELPGGIYSGRVEVGGRSARFAVAIDPPRAVPIVATDRAALDRLTQANAAAPRDVQTPAVGWVDLRPPLILLAVTALLANVALRRWPTITGGPR